MQQLMPPRNWKGARNINLNEVKKLIVGCLQLLPAQIAHTPQITSASMTPNCTCPCKGLALHALLHSEPSSKPDQQTKIYKELRSARNFRWVSPALQSQVWSDFHPLQIQSWGPALVPFLFQHRLEIFPSSPTRLRSKSLCPVFRGHALAGSTHEVARPLLHELLESSRQLSPNITPEQERCTEDALDFVLHGAVVKKTWCRIHHKCHEYVINMISCFLVAACSSINVVGAACRPPCRLVCKYAGQRTRTGRSDVKKSCYYLNCSNIKTRNDTYSIMLTSEVIHFHILAPSN